MTAIIAAMPVSMSSMCMCMPCGMCMMHMPSATLGHTPLPASARHIGA